MQAHFFMFLQHFSASTRLKKSGPACKSWHGKQDSGSKSFEVVSWPQLGPYENNSIHPLLPQGLCKPISSCFCNTSVPAQDSRNRAPLARVDMASKTQDQSLLKLYHGRSSDLMRIIQFILSCPKDYASPFLHVSATLQCQYKTQEIGPACKKIYAPVTKQNGLVFQVQCFIYIQLLPSVIGLFSTPLSRGIKLYEFRFSIIAVSVSWPRVKRKPRRSMKL